MTPPNEITSYSTEYGLNSPYTDESLKDVPITLLYTATITLFHRLPVHLLQLNSVTVYDILATFSCHQPWWMLVTFMRGLLTIISGNMCHWSQRMKTFIQW